MLKILSVLKEMDERAAEMRTECAATITRLDALEMSERIVTEREAAVRDAEVNAAARSAELDAREVAVAKREAGTSDLRNQLAIARAGRLGAIENETALAKKLEDARRELNAARSELGTFKAAMRTVLPAATEAAK